MTSVAKPEPLQPGDGEQGRLDLAALDFRQPRADVAAQQRELEVRPQPPDHRLAPQRGGADARAARQPRDARRQAADEGVADVLSRQVAGDDEAVRQECRQVLRGMHREIDRALGEREIELLREQPLAAGLRQRPVLDRVAGGLDDAERQLRLIEAERRREPVLRLARLGERERAAARADG